MMDSSRTFQRNRQRMIAPATALLILPFLTNIALGQSMTSEEVAGLWGSGGDRLSSLFLTQIFGPLFSIDGMETVQTPIFPLAISIFNVMCLVIGGLLFLYNVIAGVIQTAHEGEVLGRRWSSLWAPIRVLVAVAMLTPLPGYNGYNTVQTFIAYLVDGSTRAASALWSEVAEAVVSGERPITGAAPDLPVDAAQMAWNMQVCRATIIKQLSSARIQGASQVDGRISFGDSSGAPYFESMEAKEITDQFVQNLVSRFDNRWFASWRFSRSDIAQLEDIQTGYKHASVPPKAFLTIPHSSVPSQTIIDNNMNAMTLCGVIATPPVPQSILNFGDPGLEQRFVDAHAHAIQIAIQNFQDPAFQVVEAISTGRPAPLTADAIADTIVDMRNSIVGDLADVMVVSRTVPVTTDTGQAMAKARERQMRFISGGYRTEACEVADSEEVPTCAVEAGSAQGQGWIGAGSWYMHLARLNSENHQIATSKPIIYGEPEFTSRVNRLAEQASYRRTGNHAVAMYGDPTVRSARDEAEQYYQAGLQAWDDAIAQLGAFGAEFPIASTGDLLQERPSYLLEKLTDVSGWTYNLAETFSPTNFDVDPMVGVINLGHRITQAGIGFATAGGLANFIPGAGVFANAGASIGYLLIMAGSLMAFILPMMPFVFWIVAVTGYFLLVAEAIIAVNLWAIAHLRMDGEGIAGDAGRTGYYMVLALVLTPVLMIFGFIIGMAIFKVTTTLINIGLYYVIAGMNTTGGLQWAIGMIVITIMIVLVYMVLIERSFSLIMEFPSKVMQWIGANVALSSDEANRVRLAAGAASVSSAQQAAPLIGGTSYAAGYGVGAGVRGLNRLRRGKVNNLSNTP